MLSVYKKPNIYTFADLNLNVSNIDHSIFYSTLEDYYMELLLSQLQFFNMSNLKKLCSENDKVYILYIGSAKGYHLPIIFDIYNDYSNIEWHLFDQHQNCITIETTPNVVIHKKEIDDNDLINIKKNLYPLLFIYDFNTLASNTSELDLIYHFNQQKKIISYILPSFSFLKFKYPLVNNFTFLSGIQYLSPYKSNYLRIFVDNQNLFPLSLTEQGYIEFYEKMNYYNMTFSDINTEIAGYILSTNISLNHYLDKIISDLKLKIKNNIKLDLCFRHL